jgi:hypothetical protein
VRSQIQRFCTFAEARIIISNLVSSVNCYTTNQTWIFRFQALLQFTAAPKRPDIFEHRYFCFIAALDPLNKVVYPELSGIAKL